MPSMRSDVSAKPEARSKTARTRSFASTTRSGAALTVTRSAGGVPPAKKSTARHPNEGMSSRRRRALSLTRTNGTARVPEVARSAPAGTTVSTTSVRAVPLALKTTTRPAESGAAGIRRTIASATD